MKARINRAMLLQTTWDSAALAPLASVVHRFTEPGQYQGVVYQGKETVGTFLLTVDKSAPEGQLNVDLAGVYSTRYAAAGQETAFAVSPGSPVAFHVPHGHAGFAVVIRSMGVLSGPAAARTRDVIFDSRKLQKGDIFIITPVRPGTYLLTNQDRAACKIQVKPREGAGIPTEPLVITLSANGFEPNQAAAAYMQPIFCGIEAPSRIQVELR